MANLDKPILKEYIGRNQSQIVTDTAEVVDEKGVKKKHWYLNGIFIQGEVENLNGRIYPSHEIENAVSSLQEQIKLHGGVLGELDHPDTLVINIQNVSHLITEMQMRGTDGYGKMKILSNTPSGRIVEGLLEDSVPLGVSSRGSGNVDDYSSMVSGFEIVTVDIVATPSAQDARPTAIYEKFQNGAGKHLYNNTQDLISSNNQRLAKALNDDIITWFKSWSHK